MPAMPAVRRARGPFVVPARTVLLLAGLLSIALGGFNLGHELHSKNVDWIYVGAGALTGIIWLVSLLFAFRGSRFGVLTAGLIAFAEFCVIASSHFVTTTWDIDVYANKEGLEVAAVIIALLVTCALTMMAAIVSWSHPIGRSARLTTAPLLIVALLGAILTVLYLTDSVQRKDFGTLKPEDGAFLAAMELILWLAGAFWIERARWRGAIAVMLGTFPISYAFIALHVVAGGTPVSLIAAKRGVVWAAIAVDMAILASASFVTALALLTEYIVRRLRFRPDVEVATQSRAGH